MKCVKAKELFSFAYAVARAPILPPKTIKIIISRRYVMREFCISSRVDIVSCVGFCTLRTSRVSKRTHSSTRRKTICFYLTRNKSCRPQLDKLMRTRSNDYCIHVAKWKHCLAERKRLKKCCFSNFFMCQ